MSTVKLSAADETARLSCRVSARIKRRAEEEEALLELVEAGPRGLYDQVRTDDLMFYFKFPAGYKVPLPGQIGNYNPDWGLARIGPDGMTLHYVRETKGSENLEKLQFSHEKRKIVCAQKYFAALGVDYRPIKGDRADWYESQVVTLGLGV